MYQQDAHTKAYHMKMIKIKKLKYFKFKLKFYLIIKSLKYLLNKKSNILKLF